MISNSIIIFLIIFILRYNDIYIIQKYIIDNKNKQIQELKEILDIKNNEIKELKELKETFIYKGFKELKELKEMLDNNDTELKELNEIIDNKK